jgi:hypothetical protein
VQEGRVDLAELSRAAKGQGGIEAFAKERQGWLHARAVPRREQQTLDRKPPAVMGAGQGTNLGSNLCVWL